MNTPDTDREIQPHRLPTIVLALIVPVIAVIAVVVTLNVTSNDRVGGSASASAGAASGATITIKNFLYEPATLKVAAGSTVKVVNADGTKHTVTATKGGFDTGDLDGGASASITVDAPGRSTYFCDIHNYMTGVIEAS